MLVTTIHRMTTRTRAADRGGAKLLVRVGAVVAAGAVLTPGVSLGEPCDPGRVYFTQASASIGGTPMQGLEMYWPFGTIEPNTVPRGPGHTYSSTQGGVHPMAGYYSRVFLWSMPSNCLHSSFGLVDWFCNGSSGVRGTTIDCPGRNIYRNYKFKAVVMGVRGVSPGEVIMERVLPVGQFCRWGRFGAGGQFVPIVDGVQASGCTITGANTPVLRFSGITDADEGQYVFGAAPIGGLPEGVDVCTLYVDRPAPDLSFFPQPREACIGGVTEFVVNATVSGGGDLVYQWSRDGDVLVDGITARGDVVTGATTGALSIGSLNAQSAGDVWCLVSSGQYSNPTYPVHLSVSSNATVPVISQQPQGVNRCGRDPAAAVFSVAVADQAGTYAFQWRRDGVPLIDDGRIWGANWPTLEIDSPVASDNASYDCVVSRGCASATSSAASLSVCSADFNCDAFLDFFDVDAFIVAFESGDPSADFNGDGFLDFFDADAFAAAFEAGC